MSDKRIGLYTEKVECISYTLLRSISLGEYQIFLITDIALNDEQHKIYLEKTKKISSIVVLDITADPFPFDVLCIEMLPKFSRICLNKWCRSSKKVIAISYSTNVHISLYENLVSQLKEIIKYFPESLKFSHVGFLNGFLSFDLYTLISKRYLLGFDVHSKYLEDGELSQKMHCLDWVPEDKRRYKFNFLGNLLPELRGKILKEIKQYFSFSEEVEANIPAFYNKNIDSEVMWVEYDHSTPFEKRGLPPQEYIDCLTQSDFTLCPPGYINLTHRLVEALVRGSIPILDSCELSLYDCGLQDSVNCIAVIGDDWISALNRSLRCLIQI